MVGNLTTRITLAAQERPCCIQYVSYSSFHDNATQGEEENDC